MTLEFPQVELPQLEYGKLFPLKDPAFILIDDSDQNHQNPGEARIEKLAHEVFDQYDKYQALSTKASESYFTYEEQKDNKERTKSDPSREAASEYDEALRHAVLQFAISTSSM